MVYGHSPVGKLLFGSIITMLSCKSNFFRFSLTNESSDDSEEVLPLTLDRIEYELPSLARVAQRELTFSVASMFLTSPVINDSEKSILAFHSCVKNAKRNCLAVNLPNIS